MANDEDAENFIIWNLGIYKDKTSDQINELKPSQINERQLNLPKGVEEIMEFIPQMCCTQKTN